MANSMKLRPDGTVEKKLQYRQLQYRYCTVQLQGYGTVKRLNLYELL